MLRLALTLGVLLLASGCRATWKLVPYQAQSVSVAQATEDLERLLLTSRASSRPLRVELKATFANIFYAGPQGAVSSALSFQDVSRMELVHAEGYPEFDVDVLDSKNERLFRYEATSQEKAQAFIDALASLAANVVPRAAAPQGKPL